SDRQRERNYCSTECILCALQCGAEVCMFLVELGDHHHPRNHELVGISPRLFRLHFNAFDSVNDDDGAVCDAQCRTSMGHESGVSGRIYKIKFGIAMIEMCECGIECNFASDGIFFVVGNGGSFIYLSPARCGSGDVEKRADKLRLPCVAMSNDSEISDGFGRIDFHTFESFQTCEFLRRVDLGPVIYL